MFAWLCVAAADKLSVFYWAKITHFNISPSTEYSITIEVNGCNYSLFPFIFQPFYL